MVAKKLNEKVHYNLNRAHWPTDDDARPPATMLAIPLWAFNPRGKKVTEHILKNSPKYLLYSYFHF